ncbi:hypothetical protein GSH19_04055 [Lactobacillus sp. S2-2]|uniref:ADP-ribosyltransferase n=1 Tax=Lactobacillus sp. S2-2 TaxID=2692917 RepID=UPI001F21C487|nr:ADP-ribosyltransferase [Lactobacillus sp. S2-2]MCF6515328.1 hypothetical protein [Lactobacillus sp. S2-2]
MIKRNLKVLLASLIFILTISLSSGEIDASNQLSNADLKDSSVVRYNEYLTTKVNNVGPKAFVTKTKIKANANNVAVTIPKNKVIYIKKKLNDNQYLVTRSQTKKAKTMKINYNQNNFYDNSTKKLNKTEYDNLISTAKNWGKNLTKAEKSAIYDYTLDSYYAMNSYLRYPNAHYSDKTKNRVDLVKNSINTYYLNDPMTVYRGISSNVLQSSLMNKYNGSQQTNYNINKLALGSTYLDNGFSSTSLNKMTAAQFTDNFMLKINLPNGNLGGYISSLSASKTENEFLLNPSNKFIVTNIQKAKSTITERYTLRQNGRTHVRENKQDKTYTYITLNLKA